MITLSILSSISFKEVITGIELVDITGDGKDNLVMSTMGGDFRVYDFVMGDWLDILKRYHKEFDFIHASPPCQRYSSMTADKSKHKAMIPITRRVLQSIGRPYIIENVPGARREMINPLMLCGTMFDLHVIRHRYFESNPQIWFSSRSCSPNT